MCIDPILLAIVLTGISIFAALLITHIYFKKGLRDNREENDITDSEILAELRGDTKASFRRKNGKRYKNIDATFEVPGGGGANFEGTSDQPENE